MACQAGPEPLPEAVLAEGFCAFELPIQVSAPRMILTLKNNAMLLLERGIPAVTLSTDQDGDSIPETKRVLASASDLNHGLALHDGYLYASSDTTLYRWKYDEDFDTIDDDDEPTIVVNNINANGRGGAPMGHWTRTPIFDKQGRLYLSVGSEGNIDPDSFRSRIRRFDNVTAENFPIDFLTGQVFADGVRNEVGLAFDRHGVLWGVENGADRLQRADLGTDIFNDNPAENLHRFDMDATGTHYGYPYCWKEFKLPADVSQGPGSQWYWPSTFPPNDKTYTDQECRDTFAPAALAMQAHSAPLGITFYEYNFNNSERPTDCVGGFPPEMDGYAFIAFHGSWNRDTPTGYKVVYVPIDAQGQVAGTAVDLLAHEPPNAKWSDGFRPVDVAFDDCGRLLVTSDGTRNMGSKVVRIESSSTATLLASPGPTTLPAPSRASTANAPFPDAAESNPSPATSSANSPRLCHNVCFAWLLVYGLVLCFRRP